MTSGSYEVQTKAEISLKVSTFAWEYEMWISFQFVARKVFLKTTMKCESISLNTVLNDIVCLVLHAHIYLMSDTLQSTLQNTPLSAMLGAFQRGQIYVSHILPIKKEMFVFWQNVFLINVHLIIFSIWQQSRRILLKSLEKILF